MNNQSPDSLQPVELPNPEQHTAQGLDYAAQVENPVERAASSRIEQGVSVPQGNPPVAAPDPIAAVVPQIVPPHTAPPAGVAGVSVMPQIAEDNDLIEKEWVDKAKQIVEHTKHDPHLQNKEMNIMKADYLKKRYNKDLKLSE